MVGNSYRLRQSTSAVNERANPPQLVTIPDEVIVTVLKQSRKNGHDMLIVEWSHSQVSIFAVDLEQRGELVDLAIGTGA